MGWGSNLKWGDQDIDDDDEKLQQNSRGPQVTTLATAPDKDGIKTITEFRTEADGRKITVIRKVKETRQKVRVNKNVLARRSWAKFGDAKGAPPGPEPNVTYHSHENINLQLKPRKREDDHEEEDDPLSKLKSDSIVVCRNCGETGHWTLKCPKRSEIVPVQKSRPNEAPSDDSRGGAAAASGKYVPLHLRNGAREASNDRDRDEGTTIRVSNISEDTTEDDLRELFRRFGHTSRIYLAKDRQTHVSRGFAFISYADPADAQKAINKLNGYGYDNLILQVELAKPRDETPSAPVNPGSEGAGQAGWTMRGTR